MTARSETVDKIALLILTRNHGKYIRDCLDSIPEYGLNNCRIWVLDDASTDATPQIVRDFSTSNSNVTLLTNANNIHNTSKSSQRLIDESSGDYIVLMSGDDLFGPGNGIAKAVRALQADPNLALVIPRMVYLMQNPSRCAPECHGKQLVEALRSGDAGQVLEKHLYKSVSRIFLQGMVIRREIIEGFGGFDTEVLADDYAFVMRLFDFLHISGKRFLFDESICWLYRVHENNVHRDSIRQFTLIAEVFTKYLPISRRKDFRWDAMLFDDFSQWAELSRAAVTLLGRHEGARALSPSIRASLKTAAKRRDVFFICKILLSKDSDMSQRLAAVRSLARAIARNLVVWRKRQCRPGN